MPTTIKCPKCASEFDIEEVLYSEVEGKLEKQNQEKLNESLKIVEAEKKIIAEERKKLDETKKRENELFQQKVAQEKQKLEVDLRRELSKETDLKMRFLEETAVKSTEKIKQLEEKELEGLRLKNELDDLKRNSENEKKKYLLENTPKLIDEALIKQNENFDIEKKKLEMKMEQQRKLIEEMERKINQGSMQAQGEAPELLLEETLKKEFPFDQISEVGKGAEGADITHIVVNDFRQECGKILYECKDVKNWSNKWVDKLKEDMRKGKGDLAVIVSTVLPKDIDKIGKKEGIWICGFAEAKIVASILRDSLIKVHEANKMLDNVSDKKEQLYKYMTGNEFRQKWEAILDTYFIMQKQLVKERVRIIKDWSEREKQLEIMMKNAVGFIGDIKGIGGLEIKDIKLIEPDDE